MAKSAPLSEKNLDADSSFFASRLKAMKDGKNQNALAFKLDKPEKKGQSSNAVVRILPYKYAERSFPFIETFFHYNIGSEGTVPCPRNNFQNPCVICDRVNQIYKQAQRVAQKNNINPKDTDSMRANSDIARLWEMAGNIKAKKRVYCPIIVQSFNDGEPTEEQKGIKFFGFSGQLFDKRVTVEMVKKRNDKALDRYNGFPFKFSMTKGDKPIPEPEFDVLDDDGPSPIASTVEEVDKLVDSVPDIWQSLLKEKSSEEVERIFQKYLDEENEVDFSTTSKERSTVIGADNNSTREISNEFSEEISEELESAVEDLDELL